MLVKPEIAPFRSLRKQYENDEDLRRNSGIKLKLNLTWNNLSVQILQKSTNFCHLRMGLTEVIRDVSGAALPGQLIALMGPSGSGKSTLLSVLGQRCQGGTIVDGDIKVNGLPIDNRMRYISGYMFQDDFFMKILTVREHLFYMAKLKLDRRTHPKLLESRINALLDCVSLTYAENFRIGGEEQEGEKAFLSGGERRRLSLATALLGLPKILFADEPTTGLDSFNAFRITNLMRAFVKETDSSIIATIHQPQPDILALFDVIMLISNGKLMFMGNAKDALMHFKNLGFKQEMYVDDAAFLVKSISPTPHILRVQPDFVESLAIQFRKSQFYSSHMEIIKKMEKPTYRHSNTLYLAGFETPTWFHQFYWLTLRGSLEALRNPFLQWLRILQKLVLAVVIGLCFFGIVEMDQDGIQAIQGALVLLVTESTFTPMYAVMWMFPIEYPRFRIEYYNGAYSVCPYYISKIISQLPGLLIESVAFTSVVYVMANLKYTVKAFFLTNLYTFLCINVSCALGTFFSTTFKTIPGALTYLVPVEYLAVTTAGIFMKLNSIPWYASWIRYFSWLFYTFESLTILQWDDTYDISCRDALPNLMCLTSGEDILNNYYFKPNRLLGNALSLVGLCIGFYFLGYVSFIYKIKNEI